MCFSSLKKVPIARRALTIELVGYFQEKQDKHLLKVRPDSSPLGCTLRMCFPLQPQLWEVSCCSLQACVHACVCADVRIWQRGQSEYWTLAVLRNSRVNQFPWYSSLMKPQGHRGLSVQQLSDTAGLSLQMGNVCIITVLTTSWETSPKGNMLIIVIVHGDVVILHANLSCRRCPQTHSSGLHYSLHPCAFALLLHIYCISLLFILYV